MPPPTSASVRFQDDPRSQRINSNNPNNTNTNSNIQAIPPLTVTTGEGGEGEGPSPPPVPRRPDPASYSTYLVPPEFSDTTSLLNIPSQTQDSSSAEPKSRGSNTTLLSTGGLSSSIASSPSRTKSRRKNRNLSPSQADPNGNEEPRVPRGLVMNSRLRSLRYVDPPPTAPAPTPLASKHQPDATSSSITDITSSRLQNMTPERFMSTRRGASFRKALQERRNRIPGAGVGSSSVKGSYTSSSAPTTSELDTSGLLNFPDGEEKDQDDMDLQDDLTRDPRQDGQRTDHNHDNSNQPSKHGRSGTGLHSHLGPLPSVDRIDQGPPSPPLLYGSQVRRQSRTKSRSNSKTKVEAIELRATVLKLPSDLQDIDVHDSDHSRSKYSRFDDVDYYSDHDPVYFKDEKLKNGSFRREPTLPQYHSTLTDIVHGHRPDRHLFPYRSARDNWRAAKRFVKRFFLVFLIIPGWIIPNVMMARLEHEIALKNAVTASAHNMITDVGVRNNSFGIGFSKVAAGGGPGLEDEGVQGGSFEGSVTDGGEGEGGHEGSLEGPGASTEGGQAGSALPGESEGVGHAGSTENPQGEHRESAEGAGGGHEAGGEEEPMLSKWVNLIVFLLNMFAMMHLGKAAGACLEELVPKLGVSIVSVFDAMTSSSVELACAAFALMRGSVRVVQAACLGAILNNLLLMMGIALAVGGFYHNRQEIQADTSQTGMNILMIACISYVIPVALEVTFMDLRKTAAVTEDPSLSLNQTAFLKVVEEIQATVDQDVLTISKIMAIILLIIYGCCLMFQYRSRHFLVTPEAKHQGAHTIHKRNVYYWFAALGYTLMLTAQIYSAKLLVHSVESLGKQFMLKDSFVGFVLLPIVLISDLQEEVIAIRESRANRLDRTIALMIGSCMQISLLVTPLLVLLGWIIDEPMSFRFSVLEAVIFAGSVLIVNYLLQDNETHWLEGCMLLAAFLMCALAFYYDASPFESEGPPEGPPIGAAAGYSG
ncbi:hypothetical protein BGZ83_007040 [Gryganskiella cystojenkinii]|nr:hypothetical protein BGZ83_007040 [Gryganskiella cystojenkinii]